MKNNCNIPHPLNRQGTSQNERIPEASKDGYVKLDERNTLDLIRQSAEYSRYIAYYHTEDPKSIASDWSKLFSEVYDFTSGAVKISSIDELKTASELSPHLSLFIAFLQLFDIALENLNELPKRHLKFFYEEILQLKHRSSVPDKAVVFAELSKGFESVQIKKDVILIAGKDNSGKELKYKTIDETIINKAVVSDLKTLFVDKDSGGNVVSFSAAVKADTADGIKEPIASSPPSWNTFGMTKKIPAQVGFSIWSHVLNMPEGKRSITLSTSDINGFKDVRIEKLKAEYSSLKGWEPARFFTSPDSKNLLVKIDPEQPGFIPYSKEIHGGEYNISAPVLRISLLDTDHSAYNALQKVYAKGLKVTVNVKDFKSLILQNDNGDIDPSKPFFPFGNRPVSGSSKFIVGNQYAFNKYLKSFTLFAVTKDKSTINLEKREALINAEWLPYPPNNFTNDYSTDKDDLEFNSRTKNNFIRITNVDYDLDALQRTYSSDLAEFMRAKTQPLMTKDMVENFKQANKGKMLTEDMFTNILPESESKTTVPIIPAAPELESLTMEYTTESEILKDKDDSGMLHVYPFGFDKYISENSYMLPSFPNEGNLFIGISGIKKGQSVSIHFLMKESTGDTDKKTMGVNWQYFELNQPVKFKQSDLVKDTTNSFTNSGIITFAIPPAAFIGNTVLPSGFVWLYASTASQSAAYPEMISVRSQPFEVEFSDNENDPGRLAAPLNSGSVSKFEYPAEGIKKIEQPYSSYGGKMTENDPSFNNRVSELLRHKHRAVCIWDYERMILEEFPDIYRVKCISHSTNNTEYFPGHVLLVVVPRLYDSVLQDALEPRVSVGNREKILKFIGKYTSPFIKLEVINPVYEGIEIISHVSFNNDIADKEFYSAKLNEDLKNYFAPWKSGNKHDLNFHGKLYKSQIINFIEEREYVDYISFIEVKKHSQSDVQILDDLIYASNESVVLTSYKYHIIDPYTKC